MSDEHQSEVKQIAVAVAEELLGNIVNERRTERDSLIKRGLVKVVAAIVVMGAVQALALYNWKTSVDRTIEQQWPVRAQRTWVDRTAIANPAWKPASVDDVHRLSSP